MKRLIFMVMTAEIFFSLGQVCFKKSSNRIEGAHLQNVSSYLGFLKKIFSTPLIWLGLGSMTAGLAVWLLAIAQGDLSKVYPMGSVYYVLVLILSRVFLGERIDRTRIIGTLLVIAGIFFIVRS